MGRPIRGRPDPLFRRETDLAIERRPGKKALNVGADKSARMSWSALDLLGRIRDEIGCGLPLPWPRRALSKASAIEGYPAATLCVVRAPARGYQQKGQRSVRGRIIETLKQEIASEADVALLESNAAVLDAEVCVLAGAGFLEGWAIRPNKPDSPEKKGGFGLVCASETP